MNAHAISYNRCNFNCRYCIFRHRRKETTYYDYSDSEAEAGVSRLVESGLTFKFTGGEPTLAPSLMRDLNYVKEQGGSVFLDSNGSNPAILQRCFEQGYVDVLGISLKGLTREDSAWMSRVNDPSLCWDNVFRSIEVASRESVETIVTIVCYAGFGQNDLIDFITLMKPFPGILFKLNSWVPDSRLHDFSAFPPRPGEIEEQVKMFLEANPGYRDRFILIDNPDAVSDESAIRRR